MLCCGCRVYSAVFNPQYTPLSSISLICTPRRARAQFTDGWKNRSCPPHSNRAASMCGRGEREGVLTCWNMEKGVLQILIPLKYSSSRLHNVCGTWGGGANRCQRVRPLANLGGVGDLTINMTHCSATPPLYSVLERVVPRPSSPPSAAKATTLPAQYQTYTAQTPSRPRLLVRTRRRPAATLRKTPV